MALILGIDQSISNTGLCLINTDETLSTARFHSFKATGDNDVQRVIDYRRQLSRFVYEHNPEFVAFEAPLSHVQPMKKVVKDMAGDREETTMNARMALLLNQIAGATIAVLDGRSKPMVEVRPVTWRKTFLGFTTSKDLARAGHKNWKQAAMAQCNRFNMNARNQDQAEAAGIAVWASGCDAFRMMKARAA